jgi:hypothetical protein
MGKREPAWREGDDMIDERVMLTYEQAQEPITIGNMRSILTRFALAMKEAMNYTQKEDVYLMLDHFATEYAEGGCEAFAVLFHDLAREFDSTR